MNSKMLFLELANGTRLEGQRELKTFVDSVKRAQEEDQPFVEFNSELIAIRHIVRIGFAPEGF